MIDPTQQCYCDIDLLYRKCSEGEVGSAVKAAIKHGYRHIDTAKDYGNEEEIGKALKEALQENGMKREDVWVTTKLLNTDHNNVKPACLESMKKLQVDYLDLYLVRLLCGSCLQPDDDVDPLSVCLGLYLIPLSVQHAVQMHWPVTFGATDEQPPRELTPPLHETWKAMEQLVDEGLARAIGVSNFSVVKLKDLMKHARIKPAVNQIEVHPYLRNDDVIEHCRAQDIHVTAYAPLGSTGTSQMWKPPPPGDVPGPMTDALVKKLADKYDVTTGQSNYDVWKLNLSPEDYQAIANMPLQMRMCDGSWFLKPGGPYQTFEELWDEPGADGKKEQLYKALKKGCLKNTMKILPDRIIDTANGNELVALD
eukprot:jgi/Chrzof1/4351/Cz14g09220.t1